VALVTDRAQTTAEMTGDMRIDMVIGVKMIDVKMIGVRTTALASSTTTTTSRAAVEDVHHLVGAVVVDEAVAVLLHG
jgi:hypothetical protein